MLCLLVLVLAFSAAVTAKIEPSQHAEGSNSTSQLLHLTLTPHLEHLVHPPTAQQMSPHSEETSTSPAIANPLAELALRNQEAEDEPLEVQQPESCIHGVAAEPCPLMDVRRRCGTAVPIGIDRALNYTFLQARFTLVGDNFTLTMGFQDKEGKTVPLNGTDVAAFSDILVQHGCRRRWRGLVKWAGEMLCAGLFAYFVTKIMNYLPIWGMFQ
ncbi:uncharacterized protein TRAVEDRAFT_56107 [Trametes versicolor FP-101664 SS1]|uniref:uncharacterized protein n=1 Tax=Trametes versicolor (strain FP-101664) TaxID=717944 RepID=UPI0004621808|nr:uncharacterized protein TRAVEDRAFT_56107 [Trametes versicolor FP-101664 SS1]EIW62847.1 hypothetical protein TRAVEDRAFT_56107 [Trametes versicolor FP-101664 SS1]